MNEFPWLDFIRGMLTGGGQRSTPSELTAKAYPTWDEKTKRTLPPEDFMSEPVTELDRRTLGMVPPGMLYELNKQSLDRELNNAQFFNLLRRSKPKST